MILLSSYRSTIRKGSTIRINFLIEIITKSTHLEYKNQPNQTFFGDFISLFII